MSLSMVSWLIPFLCYNSCTFYSSYLILASFSELYGLDSWQLSNWLILGCSILVIFILESSSSNDLTLFIKLVLATFSSSFILLKYCTSCYLSWIFKTSYFSLRSPVDFLNSSYKLLYLFRSMLFYFYN